MLVKELIEKLSEPDGNAPVWTIDTCDCHTRFVELEPTHIGAQHLKKLKLWAETRREPPRVSEESAAWPKPLVVIAGGTWSQYPDGA